MTKKESKIYLELIKDNFDKIRKHTKLIHKLIDRIEELEKQVKVLKKE